MLCSTGFQHEGQWLRFRDTTPASPFGQDTGETFAKTAAGKKISSCKGGRDSHRALTALNPALPLEWLGGKVKAPLHTCPGELRELQVGCYLLRICKAEEQRSLFNAILRLWLQGIAKQSSSQSTFPLKK